MLDKSIFLIYTYPTKNIKGVKMGNIDFSKEGQAILDNPQLATYIMKRLANLTAKEILQGKAEINLDAEGENKLVLRFGPEPKHSSKENKSREGKLQLS